MQGMFTQFAAATAAKGTYLPIKGGADCRITDVCILIIIKLQTLPSIAKNYLRRILRELILCHLRQNIIMHKTADL